MALNSFTGDEYMTLDGCSLTPEDLVLLGTGAFKIKLSEESKTKIINARKLIDKFVMENKGVYGITTGIGNLCNFPISRDQIREMQTNIIRSHAAGVGNPLTLQRTRTLLALRVNVLAKGYSGISLKTLQQYIDAFNASCLSWVPEKGTVGASGDLAPLSHLTLGLLGEGKMWSPKTGWASAGEVLKVNDLQPIILGPKEGVALINGTQMIASFGAEAIIKAENIAKQADVVAALSVEALRGTTRAFDLNAMKLRNHKGQQEVARRLISVLHSKIYPSEISESHRNCQRVQDAYSLRCIPQVHGIVHDTLNFVRKIISEELNSATDNPLILADKGEIISAGNFHGEYPAKALDFLAIAIHELASISERRIERLVNPIHSRLPAFLVKDEGLNSGFMVTHCTAAALVSENKVLCHPASIDSISTSAGTEDHVSMGGFAARKAITVVENVERVIAIELLAACQAFEFLRPLKTTAPLEQVVKVVREVVRPLDQDRFMTPDIEAVTELLQEGKIWQAVVPYMDNFFNEEEIATETNVKVNGILQKESELKNSRMQNSDLKQDLGSQISLNCEEKANGHLHLELNGHHNGVN